VVNVARRAAIAAASVIEGATAHLCRVAPLRLPQHMRQPQQPGQVLRRDVAHIAQPVQQRAVAAAGSCGAFFGSGRGGCGDGGGGGQAGGAAVLARSPSGGRPDRRRGEGGAQGAASLGRRHLMWRGS